MKKRSLFTLMLVALLAFSLGMGTLAYYTKTFASNDNVVRAARFTVDSGGTLDENIEFDLTGKPLIPGEKRDLHEFEIYKRDTEVPVKYGVTVKGRQKLFDENSPVKLNLYKEIDGAWNLYDGGTFITDKDIEKFKIEAVWEHGDNDIAYQDAIGKVSINVVATQVDADNMPGGPDPVDPDPDPDQEDVAKAKSKLIELGGNGLQNKNPTQLSSAIIRVPSSYNQPVAFKFSEEFEYGTEERTNGKIMVRSIDSHTGYPFELSATRDSINDYTVTVELIIIKGDAADRLRYEIFVPKAGKRSDPFTGAPGIPAEPVTVTLLP